MSKELFCEAVIDLLPSYIDGLTSSETNKAMEAHLATCEDCKKQKAAMAGDNEPVTEAPAKEVDYLKTLRRKGRKKVALGIAIALFTVLLAGSVKAFLIGWPVYSVDYSVSSTGKEIVISGIVNSGETVRKVSISQVNGNAYVTVYGRLPSFLTKRASSFYHRMPDAGIDRIYLGNADNPKGTMWLKGTSSATGQNILTGGNIKPGELLVFKDSRIRISSKYPPEVSYSMSWAPAGQAVDWYAVNAENGAEICVASQRGGKSTGMLDLEGIPDGSYYFALRNSGDKLEPPDNRNIDGIYVLYRYVNYLKVNYISQQSDSFY